MALRQFILLILSLPAVKKARTANKVFMPVTCIAVVKLSRLCIPKANYNWWIL